MSCRSRSVSKLWCAALLVMCWLAVGACRTPTQVTIVVTTRLRCADLASGISIAVARSPQASEENVNNHFASATSHDCTDDGLIGTLVVTPGADVAAIVVTAGYAGQDTAKCTKDNGYKGCIVARRSVAFLEHTRLTLPIEVTLDCLNVACGTLTTCKAGACVPSKVDCTSDGCSDLGTAPLPDGGSPDGAVDGAPDGSLDGGLASDALCAVTAGGAMALQDFRNRGVARYCIDRTEVTQRDYEAFRAKTSVKAAGCPAKPGLEPAKVANAEQLYCDETTYRPAQTPDRPVVCVDRCDATTYCTAVGKRLCTGEEWPLACESGDNANSFTYGPTYNPQACNGSDFGSRAAREVASLPTCVNTGAPGSATKVFDMSGNVWEWTVDSVRGGGFLATSPELHCRGGAVPGEAYTYEIGFRCCKSVP